MGLKKFIEDIEPHFEKGAKYEKWFPVYEALATGWLSSLRCFGECTT